MVQNNDYIINGILLDKKLYENISIYEISQKTPTGPKPLRISLDEIVRFIISLDAKIKHLILFDHELFHKLFDKIKCLISKKRVITNSINHNFGKIRIDSYNSLPIEKY